MKKVLAILSSVLMLVGMQAFAADATTATSSTAAPAAAQATPGLTKIAVVNVQQVLMQSSKVAAVNTKL